MAGTKRGARPLRATLALLLVSAVLVLLPAPGARAATLPPFYTLPDPVPAGVPGDLIKYETGETLSSGQGYRVMFHSQTIQGADLVETGMIYVPNTPAPPGGRPILTVGHGTTGTADQCAPSIGGYGELLTPLLDAGFVIAATDFEGLGGPGVHPYLLGESEGRGVLDAARLALDFPGANAKNQVMIFGVSQGGHAALFANELAPTYAPELNVIGTVAEAPASHNGLMYVGAKYSPFAAAVTIAMGGGFTANYPGLDPHDVYTDAAIARFPLLDQLCMGQFLDAVSDLGYNKIFKTDPLKDPEWKAVIDASEPGRRLGGSPIFLAHGTGDDTVPYAWSQMLARELCALGETSYFRSYPGVGHEEIVGAAMADADAWMQDRFDGKPAPTKCPPEVATISPKSGLRSGGFTAQVIGSGFTGTMAVTFGSTPATFTVVDDAHLTVTVPAAAAAGSVQVKVTTDSGYTLPGAKTAFTYVDAGAGSTFTPVAPVRLLDSRTGPGWTGLLHAGYPRNLALPPVVPDDATAIVVNVTAVDSNVPSFVTVYPAASPPKPPPNASALNLDGPAPRANLVTVEVGVNKSINVATANGHTNVVFDLVGYYRPVATQGAFHPITPFRALDSRTAVGGWSGPLPAGDAYSRTLRVAGGSTPVPTGVAAVVINVTATNSTHGSFVSAWSGAGARPETSTVNFGPFETRANLAIVATQDDLIELYNAAGTTDLVIDVMGYFVTNDPTGAQFHSTPPSRVLDSRTGTGLAGAWGEGQARELAVAGSAGIPGGATGVVLNATVTNATTGSFLTVWPSGAVQPGTSNLNFGAGQTLPNAVMVGVGPSGAVSIANAHGTVDVVADVSGWFAPAPPPS